MRRVGTHEIISEHTLADGTVVALVHDGNGGWQIAMGLTDRTVSHVVTGIPVPVTTDGCVWCGTHEALAHEALALVLDCSTIREANRRSYRWWRDTVSPLING